MIYMGSKNKIATKYWQIIKDNVEITDDTHVIDIFCGSCSLIKHIPLKNKIANDISTPLIKYLKAIQKSTEWVPKDFNELNLTREKWNYIRDHKEEYSPEFIAHVGYSLSFNGSYFQGWMKPEKSDGKFYDHVKRAYKTAIKDHKELQGITFFNTDYEKVPIPPKSIIICDPPYRNTASYNILDSGFDYDRFFNFAKRMKDQGHYVFICEYAEDMPINCKVVGEIKRSSNLHGIAKKTRKGKTFKK